MLRALHTFRPWRSRSTESIERTAHRNVTGSAGSLLQYSDESRERCEDREESDGFVSGQGRQVIESPSDVNRYARGSGLRRVFIVGCPRSGTTWLQLLLAQHPDVVTSQETHLFSAYLAHLMRVWKRERGLPEERRRVGLTTVLEPDEFEDACRAFADAVFASILATSPEADLVVEKTPAHVLRGEEILRIYPEAAFLHVIRDPRDVVCSLRSAGKGWGRHWAPTNVSDGAGLWRKSVEAGLGIHRLTSRYREVRFEDLAKDAEAALAGVCAFLGLDVEHDFCKRAAEACRLERLRADGAGEDADSPWRLGAEPEGFFRRGRAQGWRDELTRAELRRVEYAASPLMSELGYEPVAGSSERPPVRIALREGLEWRLERLYGRCRRWLARL